MFNSSTKKSTDEKPLTYWEKKQFDKAAEKKKRVNIFLSRGSSSVETGSTTYEKSTGAFAGGKVESRSRVSTEGGSSEKSKFGMGKGLGSSSGVTNRGGGTSFAGGTKMSSLGKGSSATPPRKPLGF
jgi:hypothetical protein